MSGPAVPELDCTSFRRLLHQRDELPLELRHRLGGHADGCPGCRSLLLEVERVDDLLLGWTPPGPTPGLADRVLASLSGLDTLECPLARERLLLLADSELPLWQRRSLDSHLEHCPECREEWEDLSEVHRRWREWRAPQPPARFADQVITRLQLESTRPSSPPVRPWLRRAAAAVLVVGVGLIASRAFDPPVDAPGTVPSERSEKSAASASRPVEATAVSYRPRRPRAESRPGSYDPAQRFFHAHSSLERDRSRKGHVLVHLGE